MSSKALNNIEVNVVQLQTDVVSLSAVVSGGGGGGLSYFTEGENTTAPNATIPVDYFTPSTGTNVDVAISPLGTGSILAQVPDSTITGGNKRGNYSVDLQMFRSNAARVASGLSSVLVGGEENTSSGTRSTVVGGYSNTASGDYTFIGGGSNNDTSGSNSTVGGGFSNSVVSQNSVIAGGYDSTIATGANYSFIGSGFSNDITAGTYNVIVGGDSNTCGGAGWNVIVGGDSNTISNTANAINFIGTGYANTINANCSTCVIVGGQSNTMASSVWRGTICGGQSNYVAKNYGTICGGLWNRTNQEYSSILGGYYAQTDIYGQESYASGRFAVTGDAQRSFLVLRADTIDATPTVLTTNNSAASTINQLILGDYKMVSFRGTVTARTQGASPSGAAWDIDGTINRDSGAASVTLIVNNATQKFNTGGFAFALTADTTNGGLAMTFTGAAATNVRVVAEIATSEVTYP